MIPFSMCLDSACFPIYMVFTCSVFLYAVLCFFVSFVLLFTKRRLRRRRRRFVDKKKSRRGRGGQSTPRFFVFSKRHLRRRRRRFVKNKKKRNNNIFPKIGKNIIHQILGLHQKAHFAKEKSNLRAI